MIKNRYTPHQSGRRLVSRRQPLLTNEAVLGIGLIAASALGLLTMPWWQMLLTGGY